MGSYWRVYLAGFITSAVLVLPLCGWVYGYELTDTAILSLLPTVVVLFVGNFTIGAPVKRCYLQVAFRRTSPLRNILTGRIGVALSSFVFATVTGLLLGWNALSLSPPEIKAYLALLLLAILISALFVSWTRVQFRAPYSDSFSVNLSTFFLSLVFIPAVVWVNWNFVYYPGALKTATLSEVLNLSSSYLPDRRTWLVEFIAVLDAFDLIKLWLVIKLDAPGWAKILFSFDTAIASILLARAVSVINVFVMSTLPVSSEIGARNISNTGAVE